MLNEGTRVERIFFNDGEWAEVNTGGTSRMEIVMEGGQMAAVPWVMQVMDDGTTSLHNCAHLSTIRLEERSEP